MYDSIIHHLCIVLCIRHTESCLTIGVYPCPSHSITLSCLPHPQVPLIMTTLMVCVRALGDLFVLLNPWKGKIGFLGGGGCVSNQLFLFGFCLGFICKEHIAGKCLNYYKTDSVSEDY